MNGGGGSGTAGRTNPGPIQTHVPGDPAAFHALADYLRTGLGAKAGALGDETAARRSALAGTWTGEAGEAFGERSGRLVSACDATVRDAKTMAGQIDMLGETLRMTQEDLATLRAEAPARRMVVDGTLIRPDLSYLGLVGAPGEPINLDLNETATAFALWDQTAEEAQTYWRRWYDAINEVGGVASKHAADLFGYLASLITVGASRGLRTIASRILSRQSEWLREDEANLRRDAAALEDYIAKTGDKSTIAAHNRWLTRSIDQRSAAEAAAGAARDPHLPVGLRTGLGSITALATGVGIYSDMHHGESAGQAVTSQGAAVGAGAFGSWLAGEGAAALAGSIVGPEGTVGGVVIVGGAELVGGAISAIAGNATVDHFWPGGDDHSGDQPSVAEQNGGTLLKYAAQVTTPTTGPGR